MSRTKKPSKLSAETERELVALYLALGIHSERDERAFLNRIRSLNEEETEKTHVRGANRLLEYHG